MSDSDEPGTKKLGIHVPWAMWEACESISAPERPRNPINPKPSSRRRFAVDVELRDAERAAASGDPLEVERLEGLRARVEAPAPPLRAKTDDQAEVARLEQGYHDAQREYERLRDEHTSACRTLAMHVADYLRPRQGAGSAAAAGARAFHRGCMVRASARATEHEAAAEAAWAVRNAWHHACARGRSGRCPVEVPREHRAPGSFYACGHPIDAAGRCTAAAVHAHCPCDGCSGVL